MKRLGELLSKQKNSMKDFGDNLYRINTLAPNPVNDLFEVADINILEINYKTFAL